MTFLREGLPLGCELIELPFNIDERGCLVYMEYSDFVPFRIQRSFWISAVPEGKMRGGHAHVECAEFIVPVYGAFDIYVDDGICSKTIRMNSPMKGILIPANVWCQLKRFEPGTVCLVFASHSYNKDGYIDDYEYYVRYKQCR